ncbi:MAG: alpha-galactosidase, partial [Acholeplasmataceae bacterium]|nr:alpha-galactosidase [Acholeplasmataceae bacterium]
MITFEKPYFKLETKDLNYIINLLPTGQLEHIYIGNILIDTHYDALKTKLNANAGSSIDYVSGDHKASLDLMTLEYSGIGKGDYRLSPLEIKMPDGTFVTDFVYESHEIIKGIVQSKTLPQAQVNDHKVMSLIIKMKDRKFNMTLDLIYTAFYDSNVFTRRAVLSNHEEKEISIRKLMSMMLDLPESLYDLITFDGGWIKETHKNRRFLTYGTYINDSTTGNSSNRHNPGIIIAKKDAHEDYGVCIGLNLIYSGNHYEAAQISNHGLLRIMNGINPFCFEWPLKKNESFETPEAVLTYSDQGFNKLSQSFHQFINTHIIPRQFQQSKRLVALNSWEAFFFNFNQRKLKKSAHQASKLGVELFVLDDGWFGNRNDDTQGLGDYNINLKKFPNGLNELSNYVHHLGMKFGLWFEPEMVNPISELYLKHPEYAIQIGGREPSIGRNQLVLDLCNPDVRTYIVSQMSKILDETKIDYIKWDMNRHITDMYSPHVQEQGMFFHRYILGLYDILRQITEKYPHILIESCSSGGNRYDLGMLSFTPQIWASDDTDPIERLKIQQGLSYLYPQSTISAHVSLAPHSQTLRKTPLSTRFNVASFGVLGYELDLKYLTPIEKKDIKKQINLYKENRDAFQYGNFYRFNSIDENHLFWQVSKNDLHILGNYQLLSHASPNFEVIRFKGLQENQEYHVESIQQSMPISQFGHLISHA